MAAELINTTVTITALVEINHRAVVNTTLAMTVLGPETVAMATPAVAVEDAPDHQGMVGMIVRLIGGAAQAHTGGPVPSLSLTYRGDMVPMCLMCKLSCSQTLVATS